MYCFLIIQCVNVSQTVFISLNLRFTSQHLFNIHVSWDTIQVLVNTDKPDEEGRVWQLGFQGATLFAPLPPPSPL